MDGMPVLLKDNIDVAGMPTTAGSIPLEHSMPPDDSTVAANLKAAGAVILGKTNLSEYANFITNTNPSGYSGVGGQVLAAVDADLNPSGSSSGSAASAAAALAMVTIGTETSGSIISPSLTEGVVGLRPTVGLVSRYGIVPISASQDTAGPITRNVADAAAELQAIAGPDMKDHSPTLWGPGVSDTFIVPPQPLPVPNYLAALDPNALNGARIGTVTSSDANYQASLTVMRNLGAVLVPVATPSGAATPTSLLDYEFHRDLNNYLAHLGPNAPVHSLGGVFPGAPPNPALEPDVISTNNPNYPNSPDFPYTNPLVHPISLEAIKFGQTELTAAQTQQNPDDLNSPTSVTFRSNLVSGKTSSRAGFDTILTANNLAAIVAPAATLIGLGAHAGYPQITVPAGYSTTNRRPVNIAFSGTAYSEAKLIGLAYAYEQASHLRVPVSVLDPSMYRCADTVPPPPFASRGGCAPRPRAARHAGHRAEPRLPAGHDVGEGSRGEDDRRHALLRGPDEGVPGAHRRHQRGRAGDQRGPRGQPERARRRRGLRRTARRRARPRAAGRPAGARQRRRRRGRAAHHGRLGGAAELAAGRRLEARREPAGRGRDRPRQDEPTTELSVLDSEHEHAGRLLVPRRAGARPVRHGHHAERLVLRVGDCGLGRARRADDRHRGLGREQLAGVEVVSPGSRRTRSSLSSRPSGSSAARASSRSRCRRRRAACSARPCTTWPPGSPASPARTRADPATAGQPPPPLPNYLAGLVPGALVGKRIAVINNTNINYQAAITALHTAGAVTVVKTIATPSPNPADIVGRELKRDMNAYLRALPAGDPIHSLQGIVDYDNANAQEALKYGSNTLTTSNAVDLTNPATLATYTSDHDTGLTSNRAVIDTVLNNGTPADPTDDFDAIMVPSGNASIGNADRGGYPVLTVPAGYSDLTTNALPPASYTTDPVNVTFVGTAYSEPKLLADGYAYEQATRLRVSPSETNPSLWRCVPGSFFPPHSCAP